MSVCIMTSEGAEGSPPDNSSGRSIIRYLQQKQNGATMSEILQHLRLEHGKDPSELNSSVISLLENGIALGFLERKGSHYMNWMARENACCCRKRRRGSCRRRRRRRSCRRRKRRTCFCRRGRRRRRPKRCF